MLDRSIFFSRDTAFKTPFGAVPLSTPVTLTLRPHLWEGFTQCTLLAYREFAALQQEIDLPRTGSQGDRQFIDAFVSASLTVCVGAMAIIGSIQDGISGSHDTLFAKAVLDMIIILMMTASLGKGCIFSAIPVAVFQGAVTLLAREAAPLFTEAALSNISLVGNVLIFCVGVNLVWPRTVRIANILPSIVIAAAFAAWA